MLTQESVPSQKQGSFIPQQGSLADVHRATDAMALLRRCIVQGDDLRFRSLQEFQSAFLENRCIYAVNKSNQLVGFCFVKESEFSDKRHVSRCSLMIDPSLRHRGLGIKIAISIFDLVKTKYPRHDILSRSSNPTIWKLNTKTGFKEISYKQLWERYRINMVDECKNYTNLICQYKHHPTSSDFFDNIKIIDSETNRPKKIFVWEWEQETNHKISYLPLKYF